jgi:hypothetical protein
LHTGCELGVVARPNHAMQRTRDRILRYGSPVVASR